MKHSLTFFALLVASVEAAKLTYRVVAPGSTSVQVSVNGRLTELKASDASVPYFTGTTDGEESEMYKYVVNGTPEAFDRKFPAGRTATFNDFLNRPVTYANIPELPWPIEEEPQWTRMAPKHDLFDTNYIPTLLVNGNTNDLNSLITNPTSTKYPVTMTVVMVDKVVTYKNVMFGIHGAGKKKNNAKQSWNWRLATGDKLAYRTFFKLRHMEEDPTQIREKLYADISRAMGTYANEANMVRMFINNEGFGTFNLLDDITDYSYPAAMFYAGNPPAKMGALFDGGTGASFAYDPTGAGYFSWVKNLESPEEVTAIGPLCEAWANTVKTNDAAIAEFGKMFDIDRFLRFMVMEYLAGSWDGYWEMQTNDGVYRDPTDNNKWYYLGQDFDGTFGINIQTNDTTYVQWSYTKLPPLNPNAVMINGLLQNPTQKARFEKYLINTVKVLFNNVTLTNRILKYHEFLLPDLTWDRTIVQRSPGINFGWSLPQVTENLWKFVLAPNLNGGGAAYGLIEWIALKSEAVAKEFAFEITKTVVGPPSTSNVGPGATGSNGGGDNANGKYGTSGAAKDALPKGLAVAALVGASVMALVY